MFPIKYTKKLASQLFSRQKKNKSEHEISLRILQNSGKFDATWYLSEYDDIAKEPYWSENSALHYLLHGGFEGRNPNSWFDSSWYLSQYTDVTERNMNPLMHYILHGKSEGRKANLKKGGRIFKRDSVDYVREQIVSYLWGGFSIPALEKLAVIYNDKNVKSDLRFFAAWQAARWYYFVEDDISALGIADIISGMGEDFRLEKVTVMIYSFCYQRQGLASKSQGILKEFLAKKPTDEDMLLALANTYDSDQQRLDGINKIYSNNDLAPIYLKNPGKPLSLNNIRADAKGTWDENKVSVIIPTYNSSASIGIAIDSLISQSWKNIEIIVVDDCSTDDTLQVAQAYSKIDERVIAVQQGQNGGAYRARNKGLSIATGDFITTHDGDDWSHPQKIELQVKYLEKMPRVIGVCLFWIRAVDSLHFTQNWRLNSRLIHWSHSSFLFRRIVIEELGGWDNVVVGGDTEFIWRIQAKYGKWSVKNISKNIPMAFALDDEGSLTRTKSTHVKTIHYGLRNIYRSCCEWWHKNSKNHVMAEGEGRMFPAPRSMLTRDMSTLQFDSIFIADFTDSKRSYAIYKKVEALSAENKDVALFHWPKFGASMKDLNSNYFKSLLIPRVQPIVFGQNIATSDIIFADKTLIKHAPEQLPNFHDSENLVLLTDNKNVELSNKYQEKFMDVFGKKPNSKNDSISG
jgi:glycosyltransferase involved in cell wall biosynthesis